MTSRADDPTDRECSTNRSWPKRVRYPRRVNSLDGLPICVSGDAMSFRLPFSTRHFRLMLLSVTTLGAFVAAISLAEETEKPSANKTKQPAKPAEAKIPVFESDILPIFKAKCASCHNTKSRKGELDLTSFATLLKGSESGAILSKEEPDEILLLEMIEEGVMPPEGKPQLTKAERALIHHWVATGTKAKQMVVADNVPSQHDALPILYLRCTACHGLRKKEAGLDLRTKVSILKGGKSGPAMVLGKPDESLLLKRIHAIEMPPPRLLVDAGVRPVEAPELDTLKKWIAAGAPEIEMQPDIPNGQPDSLVTDEDRKFWSFQTPKRAAVPKVKNQQQVRNAIDAFVSRKQQEKGLTFSPEADRRTLIRRVAFDLTGLPPRWDEMQQFLADTSPDAYAKMVDHYLASPRYGERWGRYWLDLSGYADSEGKRSADPIRPHAWRFRDYVVRSFNNDKPYDRFLLEQLAGDELADYENAPEITQELMDNLVATGFLRMAPDGTGSDIVDTVTERLEVIVDEVNVLGSAVMGLTVKCGQCHSHKYDPFPQRDYYRLLAIFRGAYDEHDWLKPSFVVGQTKTNKPGRVLSYVTTEERDRFESEKKKYEDQITALTKELAEKKKTLPAKEFADVKKNSDKQIKELKSAIPTQPLIRALWDRGVPSPSYIYRRGEFTNPGRLVGPGLPSMLTDGKTPFDAKPPYPGSKSTGRRLAFAKWLVQDDHPLTSRVMINRIWFHHFGRGLVKSLGNFGNTGVRPSHPELLDWMAREFIARKWSIKEMHRLIMNSNTYRQVALVTPKHERLDPENEFLSRMPLRRMEAEVVRDSILLVAGKLDETRFGSPDPVNVRPDGLVTSIGTEKGWRRSVYIRHRRKEMPTILENFDLPQMIPNCTERPDSTVSSQALHLMNNGMIRDLASHFADRVRKEVGDEPYKQTERAYQIALSRMPSEKERELGISALKSLRTQWRKELGKKATDDDVRRKALANFCHAIVNSAAFLYID